MQKILKIWILMMALFSNFALANIDVSDFQPLVDSLVPGARYGLSVRSVKTGEELVNIRGSEKFTPASTLKTLTTATALHYLPLDFAPQTKVSLDGSVSNHVFSGVVSVRGEGDPNFSGRFYDNTFFMLYAMVDSIKALGIDTIRGKIELDTSYYTSPWRPSHWKPHYFEACYGAEIAPLNFNDNCTAIRVKPGEKEGDTAIVSVIPDVGYVTIKNHLVTGKKKKQKWNHTMDAFETEVTIEGVIGVAADSTTFAVPVRNPALYFKAAFLHALNKRGIVFEENVAATLGISIWSSSFSAAPLLSILDEINQRSQNFHAETLLRIIGAQKDGHGSMESGRKMERKFLTEIGVDSTGFDTWDGCGLSPKNKVAPSAETKMLSKMARHPKGRFYIGSFAGPGIGSGTKRMSGLEYPWLTRFKTGYIGGVHALAGYQYLMDGDTLAVAMYLNETGKNSDATCKNVLDTLWIRLINRTNGNYGSLLQMKQLWLSAQNVYGLYDRLDYFSNALKGRPYLLGPMGESYLDSIDRKPLINIDSVDCVTFVEHVLALSLAKHEDSVFTVLQQIRYKDGQVSYMNRKHYMLEDWVGEGKFAKPLPLAEEITVFRTLPKNDFFASKNIAYGKPDPKIRIDYLPYENALKWASNIHQGELKVVGIAFVGKSEMIDAAHTGLLIFRPEQVPVFRHASSTQKMVVELPLQSYLENIKGKFPGITLFEFLPQ